MRACEKNLLRSGSRVPAVLGILMYFNIHSGSCAPAERDLPSLATIFFTSSDTVWPVMRTWKG